MLLEFHWLQLETLIHNVYITHQRGHTEVQGKWILRSQQYEPRLLVIKDVRPQIVVMCTLNPDVLLILNEINKI